MVMQKIGDQQVAAASQAEEALEKLETEMAVLRRREEELEKLSQEDDPVYFLQVTSPALCLVVDCWLAWELILYDAITICAGAQTI